MLAESIAEQPKEKRSERLTLNFACSERRLLESLAKTQRIEAAVTARNIILDFLEGKLVPVRQQDLPGKEVAA